MKIFAHRGASRVAPENTLSAIQIALDLPIDGVEIDVYPVDDDFIVLHDRWLTRTTGLAMRFDQTTLQQISTLSAGSFRGEKQSIPLLSEILCLDWGTKVLNIELKYLNDSQHFLAYLASHLATTSDLFADNITLSSFNHHYLSSVNQQGQSYKLGWLTSSNYLDHATQAAQQGCHSINIDIDVIDRATVSHAHSLGLEVYVFTVDEEQDVEMLADIGVDGVFTNNPEYLLTVI